MLQYERLDPQAIKWRILLPDGSSVLWEGFYTGPVVLTPGEIDACASELLELDDTQLFQAAMHELRPHVAEGGKPWPAIIIHCATQTTKGFEGDLDDVINHRHATDVATYLETRAVCLVKSGDITVGRTEPWKIATETAGVEAVDVSGIEYYYLSHILLKLAMKHCQAPLPEISRLIDKLRGEPHTVIRVYALDKEMQIFLLWLKRLAGVEVLNIDANGPEVADRWNQKAPLHPKVREALQLDTEITGKGHYEILELEKQLTLICEQIGVKIPVLPGYTIERSRQDELSFTEQVLEAARLLDARYGLQLGCLKPSEAGSGARITPNIDLKDESKLRTLARSAYQNGDDYLLEAHVKYLTFTVLDHTFNLAPSAHIRYGHIAEGLTVQLMEGSVWEGNVYVDERTCESFNIKIEHYRTIRKVMNELLDGFQGKNTKSSGRDLGLVVGGIDFAIGTIGGKFNEAIFVAVQDLNFSSHGAEYMRSFLDEAKTALMAGTAGQSSKGIYVTTKVVRPSLKASLPVMRQVTDEMTKTGSYSGTIASIPGRWGMIAVAGDESIETAEKVFALEEELAHRDLISR